MRVIVLHITVSQIFCHEIRGLTISLSKYGCENTFQKSSEHHCSNGTQHNQDYTLHSSVEFDNEIDIKKFKTKNKCQGDTIQKCILQKYIGSHISFARNLK